MAFIQQRRHKNKPSSKNESKLCQRTDNFAKLMADVEIEMGQSGHDWFLQLLRLPHNFSRVLDNPCISR